MSGPENLYDEMSSLRKMCSERTQKLERCERRIAELTELAKDAIEHLKIANPCIWIEDADITNAAEWSAKRDVLVDYSGAILPGR